MAVPLMISLPHVIAERQGQRQGHDEDASEPCLSLTGDSCHGVLDLALPHGSCSNLWADDMWCF